jgi:putative hydrolase of the HAD superfamily
LPSDPPVKQVDGHFAFILRNSPPTIRGVIRAVLWDFGGVISSSPFEAFNELERASGLPKDFIRRVNATHPDTNAWARLERNEVSAAGFDAAFAEDSRALGHEVRGAAVLACLAGDIRLEMVEALRRCKRAGLVQGCLTNNVARAESELDDPRSHRLAKVMDLFDAVIESSKVGVRKPEVGFYELACATLRVAPHECVFLDDLGVNLKPAAAMGMRTIKVLGPDQALSELEDLLLIKLR